jgi:polyhydroxybutyrate depolymerase
VDDVGFLCALAESIAAEHGADERRMYIAGASNGGMMAFRTVLERPGIFAAAAGVMASLPESLEFDYADAGPIPVLFVNGTADPVLPYNGGEVRIQRQTYGRVRPVQEAVDFWVQRNRCENPPAREVPEQTPSEEGLSVVKWTYSGGDADVVLCKVEGGGHTWPGGMQYAPEFVIGKTYRGWSATETIWRFFKKQSRREA